MPNLTRNDLRVEGENINKVLDAIGFNPGGVPIVWGAAIQPDNIAVLIDFNRIVPRPVKAPLEGWDEWITKNWGTMPYDGYSDGDISELTDNMVWFKFYTRWTPAYDLLPAFRTKLSMISANERGSGYVEDQAHRGADHRSAETTGSGT